MMFRKSLIAVLCAASFGVAVPLTAGADTAIYFNTAPPSNRYEAVPPPRAGYQWSPGYWNAKNNKHVWQAGHWEQERHGYHYVAPVWTQHDNRWQLHHGQWNKGDRDGDGVPNNRDRAPDNPSRS